MKRTIIYDAKSEVRQYYKKNALWATLFGAGVVLLVILMLGVLISCLSNEQNKLLMAVVVALQLSIIPMLSLFLFGILAVKTAGVHSLRVELQDDKIIFDGEDWLYKYAREIDYRDISKVSVYWLTKTSFWRKRVGCYTVAFYVKRENDLTHGKIHKYRKAVFREFPPFFSLDEANAVVEFIKERMGNVLK